MAPHRTLSILEAQDLMARGTLSAYALCQMHLDRIKALNPTLNAFQHVAAKSALAEARQSDKRRESGALLGPLDGIPVAIKCNLSVTDIPTTAGIAARKEDIAKGDAAAVRKLREAGAVILGTTHMDEGGLSATGDNPHFGPVINPHGSNNRPSGSSSGSAVAVASSMAIAALGTDALGSLRLPASHTGVVALKPSKNLIDSTGLATCSWTFETIGPMARSSEDCFLMLAGLLGVAMDPGKISSSIAGMTLGVPREFIEKSTGLSEDVRAGFEAALNIFIGLGARLKDIDFTGYDSAAAKRAAIMVCEIESAEFHQDGLQKKPEGYSDAFKKMTSYGAQSSDDSRLKAVTTIAAAGETVDLVLMEVDAIIMPTTPFPAVNYSADTPSNIADYTMPVSMLGVPALALPAGFGRATGLPLSLQIITETLAERKAVTIARAFEAATKWDMTPKT